MFLLEDRVLFDGALGGDVAEVAENGYDANEATLTEAEITTDTESYVTADSQLSGPEKLVDLGIVDGYGDDPISTTYISRAELGLVLSRSMGDVDTAYISDLLAEGSYVVVSGGEVDFYDDIGDSSLEGDYVVISGAESGKFCIQEFSAEEGDVDPDEPVEDPVDAPDPDEPIDNSDEPVEDPTDDPDSDEPVEEPIDDPDPEEPIDNPDEPEEPEPVEDPDDPDEPIDDPEVPIEDLDEPEEPEPVEDPDEPEVPVEDPTGDPEEPIDDPEVPVEDPDDPEEPEPVEDPDEPEEPIDDPDEPIEDPVDDPEPEVPVDPVVPVEDPVDDPDPDEPVEDPTDDPDPEVPVDPVAPVEAPVDDPDPEVPVDPVVPVENPDPEANTLNVNQQFSYIEPSQVDSRYTSYDPQVVNIEDSSSENILTSLGKNHIFSDEDGDEVRRDFITDKIGSLEFSSGDLELFYKNYREYTETVYQNPVTVALRSL